LGIGLCWIELIGVVTGDVTVDDERDIVEEGGETHLLKQFLRHFWC
jgi:hypothetical protein